MPHKWPSQDSASGRNRERSIFSGFHWLNIASWGVISTYFQVSQSGLYSVSQVSTHRTALSRNGEVLSVEKGQGLWHGQGLQGSGNSRQLGKGAEFFIHELLQAIGWEQRGGQHLFPSSQRKHSGEGQQSLTAGWPCLYCTWVMEAESRHWQWHLRGILHTLPFCFCHLPTKTVRFSNSSHLWRGLPWWLTG